MGNPQKWKGLRKWVQGITLFLWVVLFIASANLLWPVSLLQLPAQSDPLLMISQSIASRTWTAGILICLITILLTLTFGRVWCGWICPVGTVLDIFPGKKEDNKSHSSENLRTIKYLLLAAILLSAVFGNLSLLILDPITLWIRTLTGSIWPALNTTFTAGEVFFSQISWMDEPLQWLDQIARPVIFPLEEVGTRFVWLPITIFSIILLANLVARRFWCRYLCPLGGLLGWISRYAIIKRQVSSDCTQCGFCSKNCPTGTIDPKNGFISDPAECIVCMNCLSDCPGQKIKFSANLPKYEHFTYDPGRRAFLAGSAITVTGLAVLETDHNLHLAPATLLRPPGASDSDLLQKCIRCGLCLRSCPTGALQPSITESGFLGLFTPVVVPRLGYCLYSCNNCGQVCPVEAIPALDLDSKHQQVIGHAFIDTDRCIPWSEGASCIVCEEMCPLPDKAIVLEEKEMRTPDGTYVITKLPYVLRERCIGCGICEYKCPRSGESAIRVFHTDDEYSVLKKSATKTLIARITRQKKQSIPQG